MHDYQNDPEFREMLEAANAEAQSSMKMLAFAIIAMVTVVMLGLLYLLLR